MHSQSNKTNPSVEKITTQTILEERGGQLYKLMWKAGPFTQHRSCLVLLSQTERERERRGERQRQRETETERDRETETERDTQRQREML